jgi:hypothetical protein
MNDASRGQWYQPVRQVASLPGQRLLFERVAEEHDDLQLTLRGARFLFDAGHGLPGAKETVQKILWEVRG